tara:strand:+ start:223 stop:438 length:216 start_codon:yes stop_codon:yes gene_type:complete
MRRLLRIEGHPELARDPNSGMIVNINKSNSKRQIAIREQKLKERKEIDDMKSDISDIKTMLQTLIESKSNG